MTPGRAESLRVHSAVLPILGAEGAILAILIVLLSVLLAFCRIFSVFPVTNHSVHFSHSVVSNSLRPLGLQHAGPPHLSPTPGAYSDSCPLSQ